MPYTFSVINSRVRLPTRKQKVGLMHLTCSHCYPHCRAPSKDRNTFTFALTSPANSDAELADGPPLFH